MSYLVESVSSRPCGVIVTCIIPTYNYAGYIPTAVKSVMIQEPTVECIIVDDGSTDGTSIVAEELRGVRYVKQANAGVASARNRGASLAAGEYIQFLDADDWLAPAKISACLSAIEDTHTIPFTRMVNVYESRSGALKHRGYRAIRRMLGDKQRWSTERPLESLLLNEVGVMSPLYPRRALLEVSGFDESLRVLEDIEINFRLALAGYRFKPVPIVGAYCRNHTSPGRGRTNPKKYEYEFDALKKMAEAAQATEGAWTPSLRRVFAYRFAHLSTKPSSVAHDALQMARGLDAAPRFSPMPLLDRYYRAKYDAS